MNNRICFTDDNVVHVDGNVNPVRDKEIIDTELQLKDLESVEAKIKKVEKMAKTGNDKDAKKAYEVLTTVKDLLEQGKSARAANLSENDMVHVADCCLLTIKPVLYVCNVDEASVKTGNKYVDAVKESVKGEGAEILVITAAMESKI